MEHKVTHSIDSAYGCQIGMQILLTMLLTNIVFIYFPMFNL